jgi:hypothetical protein
MLRGSEGGDGNGTDPCPMPTLFCFGFVLPEFVLFYILFCRHRGPRHGVASAAGPPLPSRRGASRVSASDVHS